MVFQKQAEEAYAETLDEILKLKDALQITQNKRSHTQNNNGLPENSPLKPYRVATLQKGNSNQHEERDDDEITPRTKPNKRTKAIWKRLGIDQEDFLSRMEYHSQQSRDNLQSLRQEISNQESSFVTPSPSINSKSKSISRTLRDIQKWDQNRNQKLECLRIAKRVAQDSEISKKPLHVVNPKSKEILRKATELSSLSVVDRLYVMQYYYDQKKDEKTKALLNEKYPFKPTLVSKSPLPSSVCAKKQKPKEIKKEPLFTPRINKKSQRLSHGFDNIESRLLHVKNAYDSHISHLRNTEIRNIDKLASTSKVIPASKKLLKYKKEAKTSTPIKDSDCCCLLNPKLKRVISTQEAHMLYERSRAWDISRKEKTAMERRRRRQLETQDVTSSRSEEEAVEFYQRHTVDWLRNRDERIDAAFIKQYEAELDGCTFHPKVNKNSKQRNNNNGKEEIPSLLEPPEEEEEYKRGGGDANERNRIIIKSVASDGLVIPLGWEEHVTSEGYLYYYHTSSGVTTWSFPLN